MFIFKKHIAKKEKLTNQKIKSSHWTVEQWLDVYAQYAEQFSNKPSKAKDNETFIWKDKQVVVHAEKIKRLAYWVIEFRSKIAKNDKNITEEQISKFNEIENKLEDNKNEWTVEQWLDVYAQYAEQFSNKPSKAKDNETFVWKDKQGVSHTEKIKRLSNWVISFRSRIKKQDKNITEEQISKFNEIENKLEDNKNEWTIEQGLSIYAQYAEQFSNKPICSAKDNEVFIWKDEKEVSHTEKISRLANWRKRILANINNGNKGITNEQINKFNEIENKLKDNQDTWTIEQGLDIYTQYAEQFSNKPNTNAKDDETFVWKDKQEVAHTEKIKHLANWVRLFRNKIKNKDENITEEQINKFNEIENKLENNKNEWTAEQWLDVYAQYAEQFSNKPAQSAKDDATFVWKDKQGIEHTEKIKRLGVWVTEFRSKIAKNNKNITEEQINKFNEIENKLKDNRNIIKNPENLRPRLFEYLLDLLNGCHFGQINKFMLNNYLEINYNSINSVIGLNVNVAADKLMKALKTLFLEYIKNNKIKLTQTQLNNLLSSNSDNVHLDNYNPGKLNVKINLSRDSDRIDWLEFTVSCSINGRELTPQEVHKILEAKSDYIYLDDGTYIKVPKEEQEYLKQYLQNRKGNIGKIPVNKMHALLTSEQIEVELAPELQDFSYQMLEKINIPEIALPQNLGKDIELREYQKRGFDYLYWLYRNNLNGVLGDEPGVGKTPQVITFLAKLEEEGVFKQSPALLVAPKSVMLDAWTEENVQKFAPNLNVLQISGTASERLEQIKNIKNYDLIVTSYDSLRRDIDNYTNLNFSYAILDEAQAIKNPGTINTESLHEIKADRRLAVTGTPLETNLTDLQSIFRWLIPGFLIPQYIKSIDINDPADLAELQNYIYPFVLRRTKAECLPELPPKTEILEKFDLSPEQWQAYKQTIQDYHQNRNSLSRVEVLSVISKLIKICNHSATIKQGDYININNESVIIESAKFQRFKELITEIIQNGEKVIVFSQYVEMLKIMEEYFLREGIKSVRISGSVNNKNRQAAIAEFQKSPDKSVFLGSLRASGTGITLTAGSYVIMYDQWWNPAIMEQAKDRPHRFGQTKEVTIYDLITTGTIEEKIYDLQTSRKALANAVLPHDSPTGKKLIGNINKKAVMESNFKEVQKILDEETSNIIQESSH